MMLLRLAISAIFVFNIQASSQVSSATVKSENSNTAASNSTVITCDKNSFFSSYGICGPGVCCSNIPIGISGSVIFLTVAVIVLTIVFLRRSSSAVPSQPVNTEPSKEKLCEPQKEGWKEPTEPAEQLPSIHPQPMVPGPSISTDIPPFYPAI